MASGDYRGNRGKCRKVPGHGCGRLQAVQPETRYARVNGDRIAYQVVGEGAVDLALNTGSFSHVDIAWEEPGMALFLRRLASFSRLIRFDRRGTGASDPPPAERSDPAESYAEELLAVIDAAGAAKPALMGLAPEAGLM